MTMGGAGNPEVSTGLGPRFRRLWGTLAASNLGDGLLGAATPLLVASLTRDPLLVAGATAAGQLPWLLFALPSGAIVDRLDRRAVVLLVNSVRAALVILLGFVATGALGGLPAIALIYLVAFLLVSGDTFVDPAVEALVADVVAPEHLPAANSRFQGTLWFMQLFGGPPLGAALFTVWPALPFGVGAAAFLAAVVLLVGLGGSFRPERAARPNDLRAEIVEGIRWLVARPLLFQLAILAGTINTFAFAVIAIFVLYAQDVLGVGGLGYGVLLAVIGVGGLLGSLVATRVIAAVGPGRAISVGVGLGAVSGIVMAFVTNAVIAAIVTIGYGVMLTFWNVVVVSLRQELVPRQLRGRILGVYRLVAWGAQPVGALVGGILASTLGLQAPFLISGLAFVVVALVSLRVASNDAVAAARARAAAEGGTGASAART